MTLVFLVHGLMHFGHLMQYERDLKFAANLKN